MQFDGGSIAGSRVDLLPALVEHMHDPHHTKTYGKHTSFTPRASLDSDMIN
jgi:hypothetical protein